MTGLAGACAAMMRSTVADCSHAVRTRRATASSGTNAMTDGPEPETNDRDAPAARATSMASPLRGCKATAARCRWLSSPSPAPNLSKVE